jgi:hypothetical protein
MCNNQSFKEEQDPLLDFGVYGFSRDVRSQVGVVIASGGSHLAAYAAHVRLLACVHLQVVGQVISVRTKIEITHDSS